MARSRLRLTGGDRVRRNLRAVGRATGPAAGASLFRQAEEVMTTSKQLVPVDTGALRASGAVNLPEERGTSVSVELGYGASYAAAVHEDVTARHPGGGQAKFLERPLLEAAGQLAATVAADQFTSWRRSVR